jgi:hypothetical protein
MALRSVGPRFLFIAPHDDNPIPQFRLRGVSEALASSKKEKCRQHSFEHPLPCEITLQQAPAVQSYILICKGLCMRPTSKRICKQDWLEEKGFVYAMWCMKSSNALTKWQVASSKKLWAWNERQIFPNYCHPDATNAYVLMNTRKSVCIHLICQLNCIFSWRFSDSGSDSVYVFRD